MATLNRRARILRSRLLRPWIEPPTILEFGPGVAAMSKRRHARSHASDPSAGRRPGRILSAVRRHTGSLAATALVGVGAALLYLFLTAPVYRATGTIFIDPTLRKFTTEVSLADGLGADDAVESQISLITSERVLRRVVESERLVDDPEFAPPPQRGAVADLRNMVVGPPPAIPPDALALGNLARAVEIERARRSLVLEISVSASNPLKASRIANALLNSYILDQSRFRTEEQRRTATLIEARHKELREQVRRAEARVAAFRDANSIVSASEHDTARQQSGSLEGDRGTWLTERAPPGTRPDETATAGLDEALEGPSGTLKTKVSRKLREELAEVAAREAELASKLKARHPDLIEVRARLAELRRKVAAELQREKPPAKSVATTAHEADTVDAMNAARRNTSPAASAGTRIGLLELEKDAETSRAMLDAFLTRATAAPEQFGLANLEAHIISYASVPVRPMYPIPLLVLTLGLLGGLGVGLARALIVDTGAGPTLPHQKSAPVSPRSPPGMPPQITLPSLSRGSVASRIGAALGLRGGRASASALTQFLASLTNGDPAIETGYRQAISHLLAGLRAHAVAGSPHIVLVSASRAGVGSSTTALALAQQAAALGKRVLLVDATSHDTALSDAFAKSYTPTSVVVLDDKDDLSSIATTDKRSGLSFLPIALADLRQLSLSQRTRLAKGLRALAGGYDLVFIDAGAIAEDEAATSLLSIANEILLITEPGRGPPPALEKLLSGLGGARVTRVLRDNR